MRLQAGFLTLSVLWQALISCKGPPAPEFNQTDEQGRKQGIWESFDSEGNLESVRLYSNGLRCGKEILYYANGQVYARNHWSCDSSFEYLDSLCLVYHENGQVQLESWYDDGEPVGEWRYFSETGVLLTRQNYANGLREGVWEFYRPDGTLHFTMDYSDLEIKWQDEVMNGVRVFYDVKEDTARIEWWLGDVLVDSMIRR